MRLANLRFPNDEGRYDIRIDDGRITAIEPAHAAQPNAQPANPNYGEFATITTSTPSEPSIDFDGALAFPGLINSHDHLDFNLFPKLGNRIYNNYTEWGPDIHKNNAAEIQPILKIPQSLRTQWGIYKNLLNGFTTVVNHGEHLDTDNAPINVFQNCYSLHSVGFEPRWKWKLNHPGKKRSRPVALHVGEGTDAAAAREIDQLIRWNLFRRPLIGIHGVAMTEEQARSFRALVWCPASNYFLLDKTAPVDRLHRIVPILFGTDSTLTAGWNSWPQIRQARRAGGISDKELFAALTDNPAAAWGLKDRGALRPGAAADLVIARPRPGLTGMDAFFALNPQDLLLVLHDGKTRLFDPSLLGPITEQGLTAEDFQPTRPAPGGKYVSGDLPGLMQKIKNYYPEADFHDTIG